MLVTLVVLTTNQTLEDMKTQTEAALRVGLSPAEIKEALYQCAPYIGFPKTESALRLVNDAFAEKGIALPVESQATVTSGTAWPRRRPSSAMPSMRCTPRARRIRRTSR